MKLVLLVLILVLIIMALTGLISVIALMLEATLIFLGLPQAYILLIMTALTTGWLILNQSLLMFPVPIMSNAVSAKKANK